MEFLYLFQILITFRENSAKLFLDLILGIVKNLCMKCVSTTVCDPVFNYINPTVIDGHTQLKYRKKC